MRTEEKLLNDPGIFAAATLRRIDDERALTKCDASESARGHVDVFAVEDIGTQIDVATFDSIAQ